MKNFVKRCYEQWSRFIVAHTLKIIIFCSLLTAICATKFVTTRQISNVRGFTPYGSRAINEFDVRDEFFDQNGTGIRHTVLVIPKDGERNMLSEEMLRESIEIDKFIRNNITIHDSASEKRESFAQFCKHFCILNDPVPLFYVGLIHQKERLAQGEPLNPAINLSFPTSMIFGRKVNLLQNFYGVEYQEGASNSSKTFTNMESAEMLVFFYRAERMPGWTDDDVNDYELAVSDYFRNNFTSENVKVLAISTSLAQMELDRSGQIVQKNLAFGVIVMIACALVTSVLCALYMDQFSWFRLPVPVFGCLSPFLASATAIGAIIFLGVRNSSMLSFTPLLILAFGIDDAFLMIYMWQLISSNKRNFQRELMSSKATVDEILSERLAIVLEEIGPSILISALTNIAAETVGTFTGSPEITLLCIGSISAVVVDLIYQITFFTAVLIYCAKWELWWEQRKKSKISVETGDSKYSFEKSNHGSFSSKSSAENKQDGVRRLIEFTKKYFGQFVDFYIKFISNVIWAALICLAWTGILTFCFMFILRIEINLSMEKLFPLDSPIIEVSKIREETVLPSYTIAQLFVNKPGDLNSAKRRQRLNGLVREMEHLPYAYSDTDSSSYFIRPFMDFEATYHEMEGIDLDDVVLSKGSNDSEYFNLNDLDDFLNWPEYAHWRGYLKYHKEKASSGQMKTVLDTVMITVAYHGEELKDWYNRALMLRQWRSVVDEYKDEFNVSVLHDEGLYLDLLDNMPKNIWQSALAVLVCMGTICAIFMREIFVVVVAICVIASIMIELLGIIAIQGMTIDPIVMAVIVIAMGFSVDIPAHVSYHFYKAKKENSQSENDSDTSSDQSSLTIEDRVRSAFSSVGFPSIQATICSNICISVLIFVPLYMAKVIVIVMCLCLTLCAIHSLVLLPALFTLIYSVKESFCRRQIYHVSK